MTVQRAMKLLAGTVTVLVLLDVLHQAGHAPWRCDEECRIWQVRRDRSER